MNIYIHFCVFFRCTYMCVLIHIYGYIYAHIYIYIYFICIYVYMHIYYIYIYIHIYKIQLYLVIDVGSAIFKYVYIYDDIRNSGTGIHIYTCIYMRIYI
jgi:hypothetical protein